MTYVDRITESQFQDRLAEIEEEFDVSLDDLGIEVEYGTHPEAVDEEMRAIRGEVIKHLSDEQLAQICYWQPTAYHAADRTRALNEIKRRRQPKETPAQIQDRWAQGYHRDAVTGAWIK